MGRDVGAVASEARGSLLTQMESAIEMHVADRAIAAALKRDLQASILAAFAAIFAAASGCPDGSGKDDEAVAF